MRVAYRPVRWLRRRRAHSRYYGNPGWVIRQRVLIAVLMVLVAGLAVLVIARHGG